MLLRISIVLSVVYCLTIATYSCTKKSLDVETNEAVTSVDCPIPVLAKAISENEHTRDTFYYFFTEKNVDHLKTVDDLDALVEIVLDDIKKKILKDILKEHGDKVKYTGQSRGNKGLLFTTIEDFEYPTKGSRTANPPRGAGKVIITIGPPPQICGTPQPSHMHSGNIVSVYELHTEICFQLFSGNYGFLYNDISRIIERNLAPLWKLTGQANIDRITSSYRREIEKKPLHGWFFGALAKLNDKKAEPIAIELLDRAINNPMPDSRSIDYSAIFYLGKIRSVKSVPVLLEILGSSEKQTRYAAEALKLIKDERAVPELLKIADGRDRTQRAIAMRALVHFRDKKAIQKVLSNANNYRRMILSEAIHVKPLTEEYIPMLEETLSGEKENESELTRYSLWALGNTGSPKAKELIIAEARAGNHHAISNLRGFASESTVDYLISVLYEEVTGGHISRQSTASRTLAQMPEYTVPRILSMLETEEGWVFRFARSTMRSIYKSGLPETYSFLGPWDRIVKYPDLQYTEDGKSKDWNLSIAENRLKIAKIWREWWSERSNVVQNYSNSETNTPGNESVVKVEGERAVKKGKEADVEIDGERADEPKKETKDKVLINKGPAPGIDLFTGRQPGVCGEVGSLGLSAQEVKYYKGLLEQIVLPPYGTPKKDVDSNFRLPVYITEKFYMGDSPWLVYRLKGYPSLMYVSYRDKVVTGVHIKYPCMPQCIPIIREGDKDYKRLRERIDAGNRKALMELIVVFENYKDKLEEASWNEKWAADKIAKTELLSVIKKIKKARDSHVMKVYKRAEAVFKAKEYKEALRLYKRIAPNDRVGGVDIYARKGDCLFHLGRYEEAAKIYRICLKDYPKGSGRHNIAPKLVDVYILMGKLQEALKVYKIGRTNYGCCKFDFEERVKMLQKEARNRSVKQP